MNAPASHDTRAKAPAVRDTVTSRRSLGDVVSAYEPTGKLLKPILNDTTPEGRIHLFLCGDEHRYARVNANSAEVVQSPDDKPLTFKDPKRKAYPQVVDTSWNFTEVCCTCRGEGMSLDVSPEKLTVTSYRVKNGRGGILDRVEIGPDGQVIK